MDINHKINRDVYKTREKETCLANLATAFVRIKIKRSHNCNKIYFHKVKNENIINTKIEDKTFFKIFNDFFDFFFHFPNLSVQCHSAFIFLNLQIIYLIKKINIMNRIKNLKMSIIL